jgi:hypothetical protein
MSKVHPLKSRFGNTAADYFFAVSDRGFLGLRTLSTIADSLSKTRVQKITALWGAVF